MLLTMVIRAVLLALGLFINSDAHQFSRVRRAERKLGYSRIVGYQPRTQVTDVAALDVDQAVMEEELFLGRVPKARSIYEQGGHSKSYATLQLNRVLNPASYHSGTEVYGVTEKGSEVMGTLMEPAAWGPNATRVTFKVVYETSDIQGEHVGCQVGALYSMGKAKLDGCKSCHASVAF